jgi:hypothetical protein
MEWRGEAPKNEDCGTRKHLVWTSKHVPKSYALNPRP